LGVVRFTLQDRPVVVCLALILAIGLMSCGKLGPEHQLDHPTRQRLAAKPHAVGVPYDRFTVLRYQDRLVALKLGAVSELGDRITYEWFAADDSGRFNDPPPGSSGRGEAVERPHTGHLTIPGLPRLLWSRASTTSGWIYWSENDNETEFFSLAFGDLDEIDLNDRSGNWIRHEASTR
jgi:hypothetical protein